MSRTGVLEAEAVSCGGGGGGGFRLCIAVPAARRDATWQAEAEKYARACNAGVVFVESILTYASGEFRVQPELPGDELRKENDVAARRRCGIGLAARAGADAVLLLDDDVAFPDPETIDWGLRMLAAGAEAAACTVSDYPDNSAVFCAWRAGGWEPGTQPGCGAVMLSVQASLREAWRWVNIYNEDHLFLDGLRVARDGPHVSQAEPDDGPWPEGRARSEEAGELLSEGLSAGDGADPRFWKWQLERRKGFLEYVAGLRIPGDALRAVREALEVNAELLARSRSAPGTHPVPGAELLADWMRAWRRRQWLENRERHR